MDGGILETHGLTKVYGDQTVVKGISFSVTEGEIFGILGPNGAGKTTTLEMIEAIVPITKGTATIRGISVGDNASRIREIIGVQPQSSAFYDKLTLKELLTLHAALYGVKVDPAAILRSVQLEEKGKSYITELSGGQRQRFSIATAIVHEPAVLFLDEPTTGLDPQARRNMWDMVHDIKKRGITCVLTTHYMDEAEQLCDRVAIMDRGTIVALDTPAALIQSLLTKGFTKEVHVEQANLEDVFLDLTGRDLRE